MLTPSERTLRAKLAAAERKAKGGYTPEHAQRGQAGLLSKFELEVDPDSVLAPDERRRRAEAKRQAHMLRLALASAKARRLRTEGKAALVSVAIAAICCIVMVATTTQSVGRRGSKRGAAPPGRTRRTPGPDSRASVQFDALTRRTFRIDRTRPIPQDLRQIGRAGVSAVRTQLTGCEAMKKNISSTLEMKVRRLLNSGSVCIRERDDMHVSATVVGDTGSYVVEIDERGYAHCGCEVWGPKCSHALAVQRVTGLEAVRHG